MRLMQFLELTRKHAGLISPVDATSPTGEVGLTPLEARGADVSGTGRPDLTIGACPTI
jgi:hypothetical protein